jgi:hypothetical protein
MPEPKIPRHRFVIPIPQPRYNNIPGVRRPLPPPPSYQESFVSKYFPPGGWPPWYLPPEDVGRLKPKGK